MHKKEVTIVRGRVFAEYIGTTAAVGMAALITIKYIIAPKIAALYSDITEALGIM